MSRNILFIVEGEDLEPAFIRQMADLYKLDYEITSVRTNIHNLYSKLKDGDGFLDVKIVLKEILQKTIDSLRLQEATVTLQEKIEQIAFEIGNLDKSFESIYLIFDSELHDSVPPGVSQMEGVQKNYNQLKEMIDFFDNETEQGKLYVNYPMMESYRDCDDFFDEQYKNREVSLDVLFRRKYKEQVGQRWLANRRIDKINRESFDKLTCMNIFKLNEITTKHWRKMLYDNFIEKSNQRNVLEAEYAYICEREAVAVLNTTFFFMIDFWGRKFYNSLRQD